eukprot:gene19134-25741_t
MRSATGTKQAGGRRQRFQWVALDKAVAFEPDYDKYRKQLCNSKLWKRGIQEAKELADRRGGKELQTDFNPIDIAGKKPEGSEKIQGYYDQLFIAHKQQQKAAKVEGKDCPAGKSLKASSSAPSPPEAKAKVDGRTKAGGRGGTRSKPGDTDTDPDKGKEKGQGKDSDTPPGRTQVSRSSPRMAKEADPVQSSTKNSPAAPAAPAASPTVPTAAPEAAPTAGAGISKQSPAQEGASNTSASELSVAKQSVGKLGGAKASGSKAVASEVGESKQSGTKEGTGKAGAAKDSGAKQSRAKPTIAPATVAAKGGVNKVGRPPKQSASKAGMESQKPASANAKADLATPKPASANSKADLAPPKPASANSKADQAPPKPASPNAKADLAPPKPASANAKADLAPPKPAIANSKADLVSPKPVSANAKADLAPLKSASANAKADLATPKPASANNKADLAPPKPANTNSKADLAPTKPANANSKPEPKSHKKKTAAEKEALVPVKPAKAPLVKQPKEEPTSETEDSEDSGDSGEDEDEEMDEDDIPLSMVDSGSVQSGGLGSPSASAGTATAPSSAASPWSPKSRAPSNQSGPRSPLARAPSSQSPRSPQAKLAEAAPKPTFRPHSTSKISPPKQLVPTGPNAKAKKPAPSKDKEAVGKVVVKEAPASKIADSKGGAIGSRGAKDGSKQATPKSTGAGGGLGAVAGAAGGKPAISAAVGAAQDKTREGLAHSSPVVDWPEFLAMSAPQGEDNVPSNSKSALAWLRARACCASLCKSSETSSSSSPGGLANCGGLKGGMPAEQRALQQLLSFDTQDGGQKHGGRCREGGPEGGEAAERRCTPTNRGLDTQEVRSLTLDQMSLTAAKDIKKVRSLTLDQMSLTAAKDIKKVIRKALLNNNTRITVPGRLAVAHISPDAEQAPPSPPPAKDQPPQVTQASPPAQATPTLVNVILRVNKRTIPYLNPTSLFVSTTKSQGEGSTVYQLLGLQGALQSFGSCGKFVESWQLIASGLMLLSLNIPDCPPHGKIRGYFGAPPDPLSGPPSSALPAGGKAPGGASAAPLHPAPPASGKRPRAPLITPPPQLIGLPAGGGSVTRGPGGQFSLAPSVAGAIKRQRSSISLSPTPGSKPPPPPPLQPLNFPNRPSLSSPPPPHPLTAGGLAQSRGPSGTVGGRPTVSSPYDPSTPFYHPSWSCPGGASGGPPSANGNNGRARMYSLNTAGTGAPNGGGGAKRSSSGEVRPQPPSRTPGGTLSPRFPPQGGQGQSPAQQGGEDVGDEEMEESDLQGQFHNNCFNQQPFANNVVFEYNPWPSGQGVGAAPPSLTGMPQRSLEIGNQEAGPPQYFTYDEGIDEDTLGHAASRRSPSGTAGMDADPGGLGTAGGTEEEAAPWASGGLLVEIMLSSSDDEDTTVLGSLATPPVVTSSVPGKQGGPSPPVNGTHPTGGPSPGTGAEVCALQESNRQLRAQLTEAQAELERSLQAKAQLETKLSPCAAAGTSTPASTPTAAERSSSQLTPTAGELVVAAAAGNLAPATDQAEALWRRILSHALESHSLCSEAKQTFSKLGRDILQAAMHLSETETTCLTVAQLASELINTALSEGLEVEGRERWTLVALGRVLLKTG